MQNFLPILAGAGGLVVGYLIGLAVLKKKTALWEERLAEAREKLDGIKRDAATKIEAERARASGAETKLTETGDKLAATEKLLEGQKGKLKGLQTTLTESEALRTKATAQAEANHSARQQAEGRCKQAEAMVAQAQKSLGQLEEKLKATEAELQSQQQIAERRAKEVERLRSEVSSARSASDEGGSSLDEALDLFSETDGTLESVLQVLTMAEGQQAAVLADANGIIVAGVGEINLKEGMAATSQLVESMCKQLNDVVPFAAVRAYLFQDDQSNVITGRAFPVAGETVGLMAFGSHPPSERVMDGAMANLCSILE